MMSNREDRTPFLSSTLSALVLPGKLVLFVGGLGIAAWRGALALYWFREWLRWRTQDPSIAELYEVSWWFEIVWTVLALAAALVGFLLLRRSRPAGRPDQK